MANSWSGFGGGRIRGYGPESEKVADATLAALGPKKTLLEMRPSEFPPDTVHLMVPRDWLRGAPDIIIEKIEALCNNGGGTLVIVTGAVKLYMSPSHCDAEFKETFEYVVKWAEGKGGNGLRGLVKAEERIRRDVGDIDIEYP